ncbi:carbonic anhydrase family protein [Ligilactobacillus acidipiscis]|uniref:Carbonic anhydrase n=1 Tax=Ligilactobacillus acidipiscis TaxID=89059 RepID=A0A0R2K5H7_9LACO|nr:carbonic anhydrase family protein [Ligilactobacillus acidipiscis]KRN81405.1 carbonic anhydrase [Ligilactobacillus acidipiscis]SFV39897.1 Carbonic anhydrase [Ligilactobacillus acidipiscis]
MEYLDYALQDSWKSYSNFESPINIELPVAESKTLQQQALTFTFNASDQIIKKRQPNGDQFLATGELLVGKHKYQLQRLHFHDGSEHTLNGQQFDGEIHLVYQDENNANLVLAILCQVDKNSVEKLPLSKIYQEQVSVSELEQVLPDDLSHVTYVGSLTTPPLMADVTWIVLTQPHFISAASKAAFHDGYPNNHRKIQPLNGRKLTYYKNSSLLADNRQL